MKRRRALKRRYGHAKRSRFATTKLAVGAGIDLVDTGLTTIRERAATAQQDLRRVEKRVDWLLAHCESKP